MVEPSAAGAGMISKKVVLIGDSQVGKTCIFNRVIFGQYNDENLATYSTCHRSKDFDTIEGFPDKKLRMNLWDTAGQERYRSLTKHYLNGSDAIILVYDTTFADSLEGVKEWFGDVKDKVDPKQTVIILVGNKCDDFENNQVKISKAKE